MKENIKNAISFNEFAYIALRENKNLKDSKELASYVKEVLESLKNEDEITKDITLNKLVEEFHLSYEILKKELDSKEVVNEITIPKVEEVKKRKQSKYDISAKHILYAMMNDARYIRQYQEKLGFFKEKRI